MVKPKGWGLTPKENQMQRYSINYFNQKTIGYFGDLDGAIAYAEDFMRRLILSYVGDIVISDQYGHEVAIQTYEAVEDGSSVCGDWRVL